MCSFFVRGINSKASKKEAIFFPSYLKFTALFSPGMHPVSSKHVDYLGTTSSDKPPWLMKLDWVLEGVSAADTCCSISIYPSNSR